MHIESAHVIISAGAISIIAIPNNICTSNSEYRATHEFIVPEPLYKGQVGDGSLASYPVEPLYKGQIGGLSTRELVYKGQVGDGSLASYSGASDLQGKSWEPLYKGQVRYGHLSSYTVHGASLQELPMVS